MKVSIILPTYNGSKFIRNAINSVLNQSFRDYELIIIDDGSTDNSNEILQKYSENDKRIQCVRQEENRGVQDTLNHGLFLARGEYIARIDDDDVWIDEHKLAKQVEFLESHPDYVLVGTNFIPVDDARKEIHCFEIPENDEAIRDKMLWECHLLHPTVMFRRQSALNLGGYSNNRKMRHVEDYDLWLRLGIAGKLANLPDRSVMVAYRANSVSSKNVRQQLFNALYLTYKYRKFYGHYYYSMCRRLTELFLYGIFGISPYSRSKKYVVQFVRNNICSI